MFPKIQVKAGSVVFFIFISLSGFLPTVLYGQKIVINEVMAANATTLFDEDGDSPDWIELFNPEATTINLHGFGLSDDVDTPFKWTLPAIELAPGDFLLIFASDKDRKEVIYWHKIIDWGDEWKYRRGDSAPPANWRALHFDDSTWPIGPSGFGYGDDDDATVIQPPVTSLYVRRSFVLDNPHQAQRAVLHVDFDDAFVAYLNEFEIARANIGQPDDIPRFNQFADTDHEALMYRDGSPDKFVVENAPARLRAGKNVVAIELHNVSTTSSDLTLIPFFSLGFNYPPADSNSQVSEILNLKPTYLHTNFKISADSEMVLITDDRQQLCDQVEIKHLRRDVSLGRLPDGGAQLYLFSEPTPGQANATQGYFHLAEPPVFSPPGGAFASQVAVNISSQTPGGTIYYTTDGSIPTQESSAFGSSIILKKTTVLRAQVFASDYVPSDVVTNTYLINEQSDLPIFSLTTEPDNLWDLDHGIYVRGRNTQSAYPYFDANFWQDWERPVHVEFFESDGKACLNFDAGMKIFGGWSRAFDQKSVAIYARGRYGTREIDYQFFPDKPIHQFQTFVLRNSGNDWPSTMLRDGMMQQLVKNCNVDIQAFRPAIVFLNGEYWGIHNIREKMNEHYLANNHGVDPENIDLLENNKMVVEGNAQHYQQMLNYISSHNLRLKATYDSVRALIDIENFMDYQIAQIYFDNTDWPGNNIKYWRPRLPAGKWRWLMFDTDFGFGMYGGNNYVNNTLAFALEPNGPNWPNPPWSTFLLRKLLENDVFRIDFINRFMDYLNFYFQSDTVIYKIEVFKNQIKNEIPRHHSRWPGSAGSWAQKVNVLTTFAKRRPAYLRQHLKSMFQLNSTIVLELKITPPGVGKIRVNSITISESPWVGYYFKGLPIQLTALTQPGYRFAGWSDSATGHAIQLTLNPQHDLVITARFEPQALEFTPVVINEINYHSAVDFDPGDWIELMNLTHFPIDLSGWTLSDRNDEHRFAFPPQTTIAARGFLVLSRNKIQFNSIFPAIQNVIGNFDFGLNDGGELIRIYNPSGVLIDSLTYEDQSPWPTAPDGSGPTLELQEAVLDNACYSNWSASAVKGGTPGRQNSISLSIKGSPTDPAVFRLSQNYPNPFNSQTTIYYELPESCLVKLVLVNIRGQIVATLINKQQSVGRHEFQLSLPLEDTLNHLSTGIYFYQLEATHPGAHFSEVKKLLYLK